MKRKTMLVLAVLLLLVAGSASAQTLLPEPAPAMDTQNGSWRMNVDDVSTLTSLGYLDAELYADDFFSAEAVRNLQPGDTIAACGREFTVVSVDPADDFIDVATDAEDCVVFTPAENGTDVCALWVNDFRSCSPVGAYRLLMPLPDTFVFDYGEEYLTADDFEETVSEYCGDPDDPCSLTQYNTQIVFENGLVSMIRHSDYPEGRVFGGEP